MELLKPGCFYCVRAFSLPLGVMLSSRSSPFTCPNCAAVYEVIRVEADRADDREINCLNCGEPLAARDGQFVLKYFLLRRPGERKRARYGTG